MALQDMYMQGIQGSQTQMGIPRSFGAGDVQTGYRSGWDGGTNIYGSEADARSAYDMYSRGAGDAGPNPFSVTPEYSLGGDVGKQFQGMGPSNYQFMKGSDPNSYTMRMKTADKSGTDYTYRLNPQTGQYELADNDINTSKWNTNREWYDYMPLAMIAAPAAAALAGVGAAGVAGAAGAGAGGGAGAAGGGMLEGLMAGGLTGGAGGSTAIGTMGSGLLPTGAAGTLGAGAGVSGVSGLGAGLLPTGAAGTLGGTFGGLTQIAPYAGQLGGSLGGLQGTTSASGGASFLDQIQQLLGNNNMPNLPSGGGQQQPGQQQGGGDLSSILQSLLGLGAGYYGSQQNKDYSGNLKRIYDERAALQKPYLDQLLASYNDPNSFYSSNQYQGLKDVYQNQIDRQAGSTGRLANPTDREVLLQQHALKELGNYRQGLVSAVQGTDPRNYIDAYTKGLEVEANANNPFIAGLGKTGSGSAGTSGNPVQDIGNIINGVVKGGSWISDNWDDIVGTLFDW